MRREKSKCYFYPRFTLRYDGTNGYFVPFVEIDGRLKSNDYRTLASMNPLCRIGVGPEYFGV